MNFVTCKIAMYRLLAHFTIDNAARLVASSHVKHLAHEETSRAVTDKDKNAVLTSDAELDEGAM